ncbi:MAG: hypothetical protein LH610_02950 [Sphingomonas bacterium]|nr:hypothetical protein [Sphingomonas bacterium]
MSEFEFAFSLFGLLLGLALAEGLGGLARALKASHAVRIGWLTSLLGLFVSCDVVTFWVYGWGMRTLIPFTWPSLFSGFVVTAIYYVSASLVFPDDPEEWRDLDGHFWKHRRKVLGGVMLCNAALLATAFGLGIMTDPWSIRTIVITWSFFPLAAAAGISNQRQIVIASLVMLILLYPISVLWT